MDTRCKKDAAANHCPAARAIIAVPVGGESGRWETEKLSVTHKGRGDEKARAGLGRSGEWSTRRTAHPYGPGFVELRTHHPPRPPAGRLTHAQDVDR
jgi:hypothetical protein